MPTYTFRNKTTDEIELHEMKIAERESFLEAHPDLEQVIVPQATLDAVRLGITKPDTTFQKYVLGRIKEQHPHGSVEKRWNLAKEI